MLFNVMGFTGKYKFLSNSFMLKNPVEYDGLKYPSVEHAFQAAKILNNNHRKFISCLPKPESAKEYAKKFEARHDWFKVRLQVMETLIKTKFENNEDLKHALLETGESELINIIDTKETFWGVHKGKGENNLGKILMKVRKNLKK